MLNNFKKLPVGIKRLLIALTVVVPFFIIWILGDNLDVNTGADFILVSVIFGTPIYWIFVLIGSWVYDGFNKK